MSTSLRVGACQTPEILGDIEAAINCILTFAAEAETKHVDLLLFPECFLQGYLVNQEHLTTHAISLDSTEFEAILHKLAHIRPTLVIGLIESQNGAFFNSAAVVTNGRIDGVYRKTHLVAGERLFTPGTTYPIFTHDGFKYGINICYDAQFSEAAAHIASQGAKLLLLPAQNMMKQANAEKWKNEHNRIRAERARETGMWLVSSDVTGHRDELRVGYGPTAVIKPNGDVEDQVQLMTTGMVITEIQKEA